MICKLALSGRALPHIVFLLSCFLCPLYLRAERATYAPSANGHKVGIWRGDWRDSSRNRTIPAKIYYPEDNVGEASPVIIFSHGLGASRETYSYLGEYWAAHGYISVHVQHAGSDTPMIWEGKLRNAVDDPANYINRPKDVSFAIDQLTRLSKDQAFPLCDRMDLTRIAVAGHSFGAYTVMAIAGQAVGKDGSLNYYGPDPRIKAGLAMSSDPALTVNLDDAYRRITIPIFHMTGTKDQIGDGHNGEKNALIGDTTAAQRRVAYDHTRHAQAYLLTLKDGDHRVFSGRGSWTGEGEHDKEYRRIICIASTAFWDATLKEDAAARRWLERGGLAGLLGNAGTFEQKRPQPPIHP